MTMQLQASGAQPTRNERAWMTERLALRGARILELGCGRADTAIAIARECPDVTITALEVDRIQHELNLGVAAPPNLRFALGGAQAIPADDASFDIVWMLKSLHHVPGEMLRAALAEVRRVLVPGGLFYVSEPVFAGAYNEIMRIFHDEQAVREAAFGALRAAVDGGLFELVAEEFFDSRVHFASYDVFEQRVIGATHSVHRLSEAQHAAVRERFMQHLGAEGAAFLQPMRVDLLRKPLARADLQSHA